MNSSSGKGGRFARSGGVCAASLSALWCVPAIAQVPPGATPGGALPRVEQPVPPASRQGELFEIPRVYDRPLGLDEGPRIVVQSFKLQGAVDRPERGVRVSDAQAILDAARAAQPAQGFSINQLQEVAAKVGVYYREHGYILAQAFIPEQQVSGGVVAVQVMEGQLSGVVVEGNKGYREGVLKRPFNGLIGQTAPARRSEKFKANGFRLLHTLGNVREWVDDAWTQNYASAPSDGSAAKPASAGAKTRVARGGSYADGATRLRLSMREGLPEGTRDSFTGFRLVRELP